MGPTWNEYCSDNFSGTRCTNHMDVERNLGGRPRVGHGLGFHRRPGFGEPKPTQSMHVDLACVCMCVAGLGDAIARSPV
jgi:hypothetical protein